MTSARIAATAPAIGTLPTGPVCASGKPFGYGRGRSRHPGAQGPLVEVPEGDDPDAGLEAFDATHGRGQPAGTGLQLALGDDVRRGAALAAQHDGLAGGPLAERVPGTDAVGHVEVGPRGLNDRQGERLL